MDRAGQRTVLKQVFQDQFVHHPFILYPAFYKWRSSLKVVHHLKVGASFATIDLVSMWIPVFLCRAPKEWFTAVLVNLENSSNQTVRWWWHRRNLPKAQLLADSFDAITIWQRKEGALFRVFCKLVSKDSVFWSSGTAKIFVKVSKAVACGWICEWLLQG